LCTDVFIKTVINIICSNEGNYGSVNKDDNLLLNTSSLSIGALQWHGSRAKKLLNLIVSKNEDQAREILSATTIFSDLNRDDDFWDQRTANSLEAEKLSRLLITPEGIQTQDELLEKDINSYIIHGINLGITNMQVLAYFADLENQGRPYIAEGITQAAGKASKITLTEIHEAALLDPVLGPNKPRRNITYTRIINALPASLNINQK